MGEVEKEVLWRLIRDWHQQRCCCSIVRCHSRQPQQAEPVNKPPFRPWSTAPSRKKPSPEWRRNGQTAALPILEAATAKQPTSPIEDLLPSPSFDQSLLLLLVLMKARPPRCHLTIRLSFDGG